MEHLINPKVKSIQLSGIRQFFNMVGDYQDIISLTIGQPDFPTPTHVKEAAKAAIDQDFTTYTNNAGFLELRKAAANFVKQKYHIHYQPESEVIVTVGATEAIDITFRTILTPGSEVLLPAPIYPGYEPLIRLCGATPVFMDTTNSNFKVTADMILANITDKTRCIVLPYPSNPTGVSLTEKEVKEIANVLRGKDILILADEIYSELVYEQTHTSIAQFLPEQTIVINGLSKSHSMTGWRIGLLFAPEGIAKHIYKVHQYSVTCASSVSQKAAYEALSNGMNDAEVMRKEYMKRRDYVYSRLNHNGYQTVLPDGAFYFFVKIPEFVNSSSFDYCLKLVKENGVAVVPGSAFSGYGEGYFRLSYASSMAVLQEGLNRLLK
ncbi:aminotransferase A [Caldibacillus lycopersici]|uniref:Aminotransferase n=1 Tax=Perspicuibacillus lycopersici TaxID=1325689 RepID=A0AAE3IPY6_9BACI|nr:aminotransferase A [Perspicuibacillus lycopersici]MCU9612277.1 aminotransferase A [Perspicuibacillus lycopersici]